MTRNRHFHHLMGKKLASSKYLVQALCPSVSGRFSTYIVHAITILLNYEDRNLADFVIRSLFFLAALRISRTLDE